MRLIDADAVIPKGTKVTDDVIAVHNALAKAPTIDAVPVVHRRWGQTEYWKRANKHLILYKTNRCSICNCDISSRLAYNYCPNCGADMRGSNDE